ncbi:MFS general substrate transporter [Coniochaeta sp. PMI_546]|nr:MFS general substrate transporter [Coniochaeta sp. PMI_546]
MSTTPTEKVEVPLGAYASPDEKKIAADSIGSDSDESHHYGTGDVFAQGGQMRYYEPIAEYEGRHRYDPAAQWTEAEEKKLVRRLDYKICSWVCLMFFALQLDRGNISQALSDNFLTDLGMTTNDYNYGQTIFYLCFLSAELPSNMISKKLGPDVWIPIQMVSWSIVACAQSRLTGRSTFYVTRALLGLIEGGFIPDVVLYLSYFYKSKELPIRLSFFWGAYISTFIISAFLAFGILHLRGHNGWAGWQWMFALEGSLTAIIGVLSWFYLPPSPTQTASWFRGKDGWFTEREEVIMVNRILRDDPGKGGMHNRQGLSLKLLWEALIDYDLWPVYILGFTWSIPQQQVSSYLTLNLKQLGFDTFQTNLLTIPGYVLFLLQLILWTWVSEKINNRFLIVLMCQFYMLPLVIALEVLPNTASPWAWYAPSALLVGFPYIHAILVAITSRNAGTVRTRTVGSALYNMCVQASNIISSNIYRNEDKPYYRTGNKVLLGLIAWNIVWIIFNKYYYVVRNKKRAAKWDAMSQAEKDSYLATTKDTGSKRLDFRFAH